MTIDKTFIFDKETTTQLEDIAKFKEKTQTETLQELIENEYKKIGDIDLKQIRIERAIHRAKYED